MITPKKSLGQNFLINTGIMEKIVKAADLKSSDTVIEIGPGTGILTTELSKRVDRVIAIEKDRRLIKNLKEKFINSNVTIIEDDVLNFPIHDTRYMIHAINYKVVANIPYYITSRLLKNIFTKWSRLSSSLINNGVEDPRFVKNKSGPTPNLIVLMVQKEVAKRIMAKPPHMNLLALSIFLYAEPEIISYVSKGSFRPSPKVDSALISLRPKASSLKQDNEKLLKLMKIGFDGKRKKLSNNLSRKIKIKKEELDLIFEQMGLNKDIRAENLSLEDWQNLYAELFTKSNIG